MLKSESPPNASPAKPVEAELGQALPAAAARPLVRYTKLALRIVPVILLIAAFFVLRREFRGLSWTAVARAMDGWGHAAIFGALVLAVLSFLLMGVVEWLGLRWAGKTLPWGVAIAGSFLASAIGHAIGANLLVAGAVRARLYDRHGVGLTQVAAATLFNGMSFAVGLGALGGGGLLLASTAELSATAIPVWLARAAGVLLLTGSFGWIAICALRHGKPLKAFGRSLSLPTALDAVFQLILGVVDNGIAAGIIWILLPHGMTSYASFVGAYAVACVVGLISSVPGGAGVFEGMISTLLPDAAPAPLAAAFLGYRLSYYLLPLVIAALALAGDTLFRRR
ncbi:lysylphosphatidylglycerol synthase domain-containing protein [Phenylobacterium sp.]|uniref:lysylphosphatidylglycerol synthase domain-containing protein n=1 Tax=Phenylobacterium sp. TaxID=1871053 RepID=UPI002DEB546A|nr:lysylphosphatidylglycerol synthase domain-containing protein [Phenylobacterium sp.]